MDTDCCGNCYYIKIEKGDLFCIHPSKPAPYNKITSLRSSCRLWAFEKPKANFVVWEEDLKHVNVNKDTMLIRLIQDPAYNNVHICIANKTGYCTHTIGTLREGQLILRPNLDKIDGLIVDESGHIIVEKV